MIFFRSIWRSNFLIRLRSWEYWPFAVVYFPIFIYWLWLSAKARSLLYFTSSNPGIENGGMLGESKKKIFDLIPDRYKPLTILLSPSTSLSQTINCINNQLLSYPLICKPDIGERGWMVQKIETEEQLKTYLERTKVNFLIQEYISEPLELGVFYYRYPNANKGRVSSIVIKDMLSLTGDGVSNVKSLILKNDRAKLQWSILKIKYGNILHNIVPNGEKMELVSIGNHCKGTKFLNGNYLINSKLNKVFDDISKQIDGFYFGRFDIRVASKEDLYRGDIKIMELNGAGSEPSHVYDPNYPIASAYRSLFHHWKVLFDISIINKNNGHPYLSMADGWKEYQKLRALKNGQ